MLRHALFVPRKKGSYRKQGDSEFAEIWREFDKRFQIDFFTSEQGRVAFIDPLVRARNRIVHHGAEANSYKHIDDIDFDSGIEGQLDLTFSTTYPQFVEGEGSSANVSVTMQQLDDAVESTVALVMWVSEELREKELQAAKAPKTTQ